MSVWLGLLVSLVIVKADLNLGDKVCGQLKCKSFEYCNKHSRSCDNCTRICNQQDNNNMDKQECEEQCQDYLHDQRYVRRGETSGGEHMNMNFTSIEDTNSKVARLTILVTVALVIQVLLIIVVVALIYLMYRYRRNLRPPEYSERNGMQNGKAGGGLKIEMPPPSTTTTVVPPVTPATTSTPLSTRPRFPREDPTLEYAAYDNPALAPSPVPENKETSPSTTTTPISRRQESSF
ncbi:hypothetical protein L9F63_015725 [Diploptera punctata]|uniref:Uncharacterized protein n=1 Tax=Diploptera punctata TaxID=6984 RepID=A0AAD8EK80_DIPPU|nr:hypothetical protein L9F63_015725 [Diploptera punctata]